MEGWSSLSLLLSMWKKRKKMLLRCCDRCCRWCCSGADQLRHISATPQRAVCASFCSLFVCCSLLRKEKKSRKGESNKKKPRKQKRREEFIRETVQKLIKIRSSVSETETLRSTKQKDTDAVGFAITATPPKCRRNPPFKKVKEKQQALRHVLDSTALFFYLSLA